MHLGTGLTYLRRRVGLLALTALFAAWMPSGGAAAPVPAPAVAGVKRFAIDSSALQALYRVGETFFNRNNQFTVASRDDTRDPGPDPGRSGAPVAEPDRTDHRGPQPAHLRQPPPRPGNPEWLARVRAVPDRGVHFDLDRRPAGRPTWTAAQFPSGSPAPSRSTASPSRSPSPGRSRSVARR